MGFSVRNAALTRFFALHFLMPFILAALRGVHMLFLHQRGSSNPLGINRNLDKSPFHPYFSTKDAFGFITFLASLLIVCFLHPWNLGGVIALVISVLIIGILPFYGAHTYKARVFSP